MAKIPIIVIKYSFYVAVIVSAGFVIERLSRIKHLWRVDPIVADDLVYNESYPLQSRNYDNVLKKRYLKCLTEPTKPFCLLSANKRLEVFRSENEQQPSVEQIESRLHNITSDFPTSRRRIHTMLIEFTRIMKAYQVKVILIEPSMLFCLLSLPAKYSMLAKGFNPGRLLGSRNVINVGILDADSKKLELKNLTNEALSAGFKIIKFRKWIKDLSHEEFETAHYFFVMENVAIHVVIFYTRSNFLWHTGLDPKEIDFEGLLFVNEGIFENFTLVPLNLAGTSISNLFLPYDIRQFMRGIEVSNVVECKTNSSGIMESVEHPTLTREQLVTRAIIVVKELKTILQPYVQFFWLWSDSLLGWFTECDIFHFSTSLEFAVLYRNIQSLNLTEILAENEFLHAQNNSESNSKYGWKLDCHGLLVNVHFLYEDVNRIFQKYGESDVDVYKYPLFTVCSSELYGQKIQVPCNITDVLEVELAKNRTENVLPRI